MNKILLIAFILVTESCKISDITGTYYYKDPHNLASAQMKLNKDSTFRYEYAAGDVHHVTASGSWFSTPERHYLILNSLIKSDNDLIEVSELRNEKILNGTSVRIIDKDGAPTSAYIKLASTLSPVTFSDSDYVLRNKLYKKGNIKFIAISSLDLNSKTIIYKIENPYTNEFTIRFKANGAEKNRYFNNEKWEIKKNKILDPDSLLNSKGTIIFHKSEKGN